MTPKPLVKSECCKAKMYTVGNTTHHWRCDNCGQPCNPSETNEADYLKEFDELFGVSKDDDLITTTRYCLHNFLKSSIERARREGVNQERERWINQPANQHDEEIRKVERQRVVEMLRKLKRTDQCTCMEDYSSCPYNIALSDVKEHLNLPSDKETI